MDVYDLRTHPGQKRICMRVGATPDDYRKAANLIQARDTCIGDILADTLTEPLRDCLVHPNNRIKYLYLRQLHSDDLPKLEDISTHPHCHIETCMISIFKGMKKQVPEILQKMISNPDFVFKRFEIDTYRISSHIMNLMRKRRQNRDIRKRSLFKHCLDKLDVPNAELPVPIIGMITRIQLRRCEKDFSGRGIEVSEYLRLQKIVNHLLCVMY